MTVLIPCLYGKCQAKRVRLLPRLLSYLFPKTLGRRKGNILISITQLPLLQRAQWHSLLSTKYTRLKPELKLMLSLEDDAQQSQSPASKQQQMQQADEGKQKFLRCLKHTSCNCAVLLMSVSRLCICLPSLSGYEQLVVGFEPIRNRNILND